MSERPYDIALLGATGFTGALAAHYLAEHAPKEVRWVLAGRNERKLEEIRRSLEGLACPPRAVIKADVEDRASLLRLAADTRVLMTTVGPYAEHGDPVVDAAVEAGTDYVDITGEPDFVAGSIRRLHERAEKKGLRIVHCCGFDSIPADLGAQFTVEQLGADSAKGGPIEVRGYVRSRGTFSGGTWHSAVRGFSRIRSPENARLPRVTPAGGRTVGGIKGGIGWVKELGDWAVPMPLIDPEIVLRSAAFAPEYGPAFRYGHYARVKRFGTVVGGIAAVGGLVALAQFAPTRALLLKVRAQGDGPSEAQRKKSWFEITFVGTRGHEKVMTTVSGGDPGYSETAKMVSESALCLALDHKRLPARAGVLTPASAMGKLLRERLMAAGMRFHVKAA
jgi:short subunit dehydrogenase-like uncharacterized protein